MSSSAIRSIGMKIGQKLYAAVLTAQEYFYHFGFLDQLRLSVPVISVGNLTVGGTGKTPFVQFLLDKLRDQNLRVGIVSLNYKAEQKHLAQVNPLEPNAATLYGDEPTLLAQKNPQVPVIVGPRKWESAVHLQTHFAVDLILIDDGFQHRALYRDVDIVLLDASAGTEDLQLLPLGRAREQVSALQRADCLVLTKVNQTDELWIEDLMRILPQGRPVLQMSSQLQGAFLEEAQKKAVAFAGLGRSASFEHSLREESFYDVLEFVPFPDHHNYSENDVRMLTDKFQSLGADVMLTTEKDAVKLKALPVTLPELRVLPLLFQPVEGLTEFEAYLQGKLQTWFPNKIVRDLQ